MIQSRSAGRMLSMAGVVVGAVVMAGCAASGSRAPVVERGADHEMENGTGSRKQVQAAVVPSTKAVPRDKDGRPLIHVVQKGETLHSIAFNYGLDYREIADLNGIQNHDLIQSGKELRLPVAGTAAAIKPVEENKFSDVSIKNQPRVAKLPYTGQAVAQIEKMQEGLQKSEMMAVKAQAKPEVRTEAKIDGNADDDGGVLEWGMPTSGALISEFSESAGRKGIDIAGKQGQPIVASSSGKVVYSGNSLRGYGKLIIIKHNKVYLSAYAHNDQLLVKEGQMVSKGQKIAEMGNTDTDQVRLHFEIRRFGKPVDPAKYLPFVKS
jgi:lipoprotein NlpD